MKIFENCSFIVLVLLFAIDLHAYDINSGDILHLEVYGEPELTLDVTVDSYGYIEYPFVGKIKVIGNQIERVKNEIINKLKDGYFINPQVVAVVKSFRPFYIQGEINLPGSYPYEIGLTVRKAIALAGGLTERASKKKIYLTRAGDKTKQELKVSMGQEVISGDVILIKESFF